MQLTGAQALIKSLEMEHTEVIFGLPGGAILPAYDPILDSPIRHVLVRHEQGAGHMAEGIHSRSSTFKWKYSGPHSYTNPGSSMK